MITKLLILLFQNFMKIQGIELLKELGKNITEESLKYILTELKKGRSAENISLATVQQINIPYELAFQLVMFVKKYFKL